LLAEPTWLFKHEDGDDYDDIGWLKILVGKFILRGDGDYDDSYIEFCLEDMNAINWKGGLFLDGVRSRLMVFHERFLSLEMTRQESQLSTPKGLKILLCIY